MDIVSAGFWLLYLPDFDGGAAARRTADPRQANTLTAKASAEQSPSTSNSIMFPTLPLINLLVKVDK